VNESCGRRAVAAALALASLLATVAVSSAAEPANAVFDRIGADALATHKAPGFVFAVVHDGKVVYAKGFGLADAEHKVDAQPATRFAIGSLTKQFTAASILLLAQRGKLALDDRLAKYLPSFPNASAITLRMLLNQTSGLHPYPLLTEHRWPTSGAIALDSLITILATDKPDFAPGTRWEYSNTNYTLLGAVIAKAGGVGEGAFLQQNVFDPLGMNATGYGYAAQQRPGLAVAYQGWPKFETQQPLSVDLYAGAGAVISNAPDLAKWDVALMQNSVLDASSMRTMWMNGKLGNGAGTDYAMGFVPATLAGHREVWHNGLAPGAGGYSLNAIFPDDKLAVIVLSNGYSFDGVPEQMTARVLAAYDPKAAVGAVIAPSPAPSPAPGEQPAITARVKDWWNRLETGTVDLAQVEPTFARSLTPAMLAQVKSGIAEAGGTPTEWVYTGSQAFPGGTLYHYWIRLNGNPRTFTVGITAGGKIAGSQLQ
jgi:CubicO group peptidase (beta-lactamase class C family)